MGIVLPDFEPDRHGYPSSTAAPLRIRSATSRSATPMRSAGGLSDRSPGRGEPRAGIERRARSRRFALRFRRLPGDELTLEQRGASNVRRMIGPDWRRPGSKSSPDQDLHRKWIVQRRKGRSAFVWIDRDPAFLGRGILQYRLAQPSHERPLRTPSWPRRLLSARCHRRPGRHRRSRRHRRAPHLATPSCPVPACRQDRAWTAA